MSRWTCSSGPGSGPRPTNQTSTLTATTTAPISTGPFLMTMIECSGDSAARTVLSRARQPAPGTVAPRGCG